MSDRMMIIAGLAFALMLIPPDSLSGQRLEAQDVVLDWNLIMLDANAADHSLSPPDQGGPTRTSRAFAIVSVAMFDAWNSIHHKYTPYLSELKGYDKADVRAAVATAAHDTLTSLYPQQSSRFDSAWETAMKKVPKGVNKNKGIELGRRVAAAILELRQNDNSDLELPYHHSELPGYHRPDPLNPDQGFHAPHWGFVDPFVIGDVYDYLSPAPPTMDSEEYADAYNEVKALGGDGVNTSTERTDQQTVTGIFWSYDGTPGLGTPPRLYNQVVRTIAIQKKNSVEANARLFALVNLSMADAGIQCWYSKYYHELWRPIVAIQNGDADDNEATEVDYTWVPLGAPASNVVDGVNFTPPFPAYASGHATFGAAAFAVTARFYGTSRIRFRFTSDEYNGKNRDADGNRRPVVTRTYTDLYDAIWENAVSRIYLGIHWSFDATEGVASGELIANEVFGSALRPRKGKR